MSFVRESIKKAKRGKKLEITFFAPIVKKSCNLGIKIYFWFSFFVWSFPMLFVCRKDGKLRVLIFIHIHANRTDGAKNCILDLFSFYLNIFSVLLYYQDFFMQRIDILRPRLEIHLIIIFCSTRVKSGKKEKKSPSSSLLLLLSCFFTTLRLASEGNSGLGRHL